TQDDRKLRLEKYRRQRYRLELLRLFLRETLGPAAANVALPWPAEPSQGQKERADDLAEQFVEEWVKQGQLIGESSVKRPAVGREGPQGPGRWTSRRGRRRGRRGAGGGHAPERRGGRGRARTG